MPLTQPDKDLANRTVKEALQQIELLVNQRRRLGLLLQENLSDQEQWDILETLKTSTLKEAGQYIFLDSKDFCEASLPSLFYAALVDFRENRPFMIDLPMILQNNPQTSSPFINRAILWQRLCDRLIEDEDPRRPTILVMNDFDRADRATQHDFARLVRFHASLRIRRTFLLTVKKESLGLLEPEVRDLVDQNIDLP